MRLEAFNIYLQTLFLSKFLGKLNGEPIGIVQMEGLYTVYKVALQVFGHLVEFLNALLERVGKAVFFPAEFGEHLFAVLLQFGIKFAVLINDGGSDLTQTIPGNVQLHGVTDTAADKTAQDIALIYVGRSHAPLIAQNKGGAADMIGNDSEGFDRFRTVLIILVRKLGDNGNDPGKSIRIKNALYPLQRGDSPVKAHARIYIFLSQRLKLALRHLVVFHKYIVPDLQILVAVAAGMTVGAAGFCAGIVENLRIRAAGTGKSGRSPPVVLFGQIYDMREICAHLYPAVVRYGVARTVGVSFKAGKEELFFGDTQPLFVRKKFPAVSDGFLLKIVAQRPVTQHLKEGTVGSVAYFVNIPGTHTLLDIGKAGTGRMLLPHKIRNEGMHARSGKQNSGVILRDQRSAGDYRMSFGLKEIKVELTQLRTCEITHTFLLNM